LRERLRLSGRSRQIQRFGFIFTILLKLNMKNIYLTLILAGAAMCSGTALMAGNPDRQGEAGANQLLINPWARTAGLHAMNTSNVRGADAMYLNVAGLSRINKLQVQLGHTRYMEGADIGINALGLAKKVGNGAIGVSLVSFDLGDFFQTTEDVPGGTGAIFSPNFFNMTVSYSHLFDKVSVGVSAKFVNEAVTNVSARAFALDAGVQYFSGDNDEFKFGISLRNVGSKMRFAGEGLSTPRPNPNININDYPITYYQRSSAYELPSQLNIGLSYDWLLSKRDRITFVGNFTSNAFSRDQVGGGIELALGELFSLRGGYKTELNAGDQGTLDNGLSAGLSVQLPLKKDSESRLALDYAYRATRVYNGIHNFGLRIDL